MLSAAHDLAPERHDSVGAVLSALARKGLRPTEVELIDGLPIIRARADEPVITYSMVREALDDDRSISPTSTCWWRCCGSATCAIRGDAVVRRSPGRVRDDHDHPAGFRQGVEPSPDLGEPLPVRDAIITLTTLRERTDHVLVGDDRGFVGNDLVPFDQLVGHRQVTDAQLLAIARRHGGRLVSFDSGVAQLGEDTVVRPR